jgi:hypothetical protein
VYRGRIKRQPYETGDATDMKRGRSAESVFQLRVLEVLYTRRPLLSLFAGSRLLDVHSPVPIAKRENGSTSSYPPDHNLLSQDRHHLTHPTHDVLDDDSSDGRPSHVFLCYYRRAVVVR